MQAVRFAETGICPVDRPKSTCAASASGCLEVVDPKAFRTDEALALHKHVGHFSTVMTLFYLSSNNFDCRLSQWLQEEQLTARQRDLVNKAAAGFFRVHQDMDRSQALSAHLDALDSQLGG